MEQHCLTDGNQRRMRVSTSHLQQLAIFTTVLTGGGVATMYYLMQKKFSESDWHRLALQKLEACPAALESLGVPPLKVYNIHLTDRHNHLDRDSARMKIPVTGSKSGGYVFTSTTRDPETNRWRLKRVVLQLREGQIIDLLTPPPPATEQAQTSELTHEADTDLWH
ncbi:cytochrome c oxidase assembly factor 1 homolog [Solea solea]|uniref:cytochrome c oxidase assembly factor 1 homolog n=1 Tax=Solea solea TaxID=90069 RepID=UPI00272D9C12|nr:cytochrome c oxidase assembly factor 1 homolog [Solea solea]